MILPLDTASRAAQAAEMAVGWRDVFPELGEPVAGQPCEYAAAATGGALDATSVDACRAGFAAVAAEDASQLRGMSALAVAQVVGGVGRSLNELSTVLESLGVVMATHAERLATLRHESATALHRAALRFDEAAATRLAASRAKAALAAAERALHLARSNPPAAAEATAHLAVCERQYWAARAQLVAAERADADATDALALSRGEHAALGADEVALMRATWLALGDIELGGLRDPSGVIDTLGGWAGAAWGWTGGALIDVVTGLADAAVAFADGRMLDSLHHLSDAIDGAIRLTTAIAVVVVVAGSTVCPGALAALPAVIAAGQALSYAEVATTGVLALSQHPHPETAEPVGAVDLVAAAVGAAAGRAAGSAGVGSMVGGTRVVQRGALRRAGAGPGAERAFVRSASENAAVLAAAGAGSPTLLNPATGRVVGGAARTRLIERATVELTADSIRTQLGVTIDDVIVANVVEELIGPQAAAAATVTLDAIDPQAEQIVDRYVVGVVAAQLRSVADAWRRGPGLTPGTAPYHLVAA